MRDKESLPVQVERERLLYGNIWGTVIPTYVLCGVVFLTLKDDVIQWPLAAWALSVSASKTWLWLYARWRLGRPIERTRTGALMLMNAIDGAAWGSLTWAAIGHTSLAGSILVFAVTAGCTGGAIWTLGPVFPALSAFLFGIVLVSASKWATMKDPAYATLAFGGVVFLVTSIHQGLTSSRAAGTAIALRFQNTELIEQLRAASVAKAKFLAAASHDLRQPMHAQSLFIESLAHTSLTQEQRHMVEGARAASEASSAMLDALLDFSRIEAGVIVPTERVFALQPLLHQLEQEMAPQAEAKGLVYRCRESRAVVRSDPALVERILRNLISNAIRYTRTGGVFIGCRKRGAQVVVEVWDTGIGVAPEEQRNIFNEFYQLGNSERDRDKGLGLGLAIADNLAKKLGQGISLASRPGRGSVFRLTLKLANEPVFAEQARKPIEPLSLHVLVIDDDALVREAMQCMLAEWGCSADAVESIEQALRAAHERRPSVVISDYRLRDRHTGSQAVAALRASLGDIPALLLTGDTAPERLREAHGAGLPLLHKPVRAALLHRTLAEITKTTPGVP